MDKWSPGCGGTSDCDSLVLMACYCLMEQIHVSKLIRVEPQVTEYLQIYRNLVRYYIVMNACMSLWSLIKLVVEMNS